MRSANALISISVTLLLFATADATSKTHAKSIFVFGDSLSDTGMPHGAYAYTHKQAPPASPQKYWRGRWSNGPIWADYIARWMNVSLTSFAVAGATAQNLYGDNATWISYGVEVPLQNLPQEIGIFSQYLASNPNVSMTSSICIVVAGVNDLGWLTSNLDVVFNQTALAEFIGSLVGNILGSASTLATQFNCSGVVVSNLAALQLTPIFFNTPGSDLLEPVVVDIITSINEALASGVVDLRAQFKNSTLTSIALYDMYSMMPKVVSNCSSYHLSNCTSRCLSTSPYEMESGPSSTTNYTVSSICPNPNKFLFWDELHPTSYAHEMFAVRMLQVICQRLRMC